MVPGFLGRRRGKAPARERAGDRNMVSVYLMLSWTCHCTILQEFRQESWHLLFIIYRWNFSAVHTHWSRRKLGFRLPPPARHLSRAVDRANSNSVLHCVSIDLSGIAPKSAPRCGALERGSFGFLGGEVVMYFVLLLSEVDWKVQAYGCSGNTSFVSIDVHSLPGCSSHYRQ